jgi:hypothetical protein
MGDDDTMLSANTTTNYQQQLAFTTIDYLLFVSKKNMPQGGFEPPSKDTKRNKGGISLILAYMRPGKSSKLERCTPSKI